MEDGFTFVETLSVLAIGAVLAAGSTVSTTRIISLAKKTSAKNQIDQFYIGVQEYFLDCGSFPTSEQGLMALWEKPYLYPVPENWNGPYINKKPKRDPWGNEYIYINKNSGFLLETVPENLPYVIMSYGSDGIEGGKGEDIVSWE